MDHRFIGVKIQRKRVNLSDRRQHPEESVKIRGGQKVPDVAKIRDRKSDPWVVGARLVGLRAGWPWALTAAATGPAPLS